MWSIQLTLVLASLHFVIGQKTITINTKLGKIIGLERRTVIDDYPYYSFRRIPFTEPRIGEQRFDPPKLNQKPWSGTFNATEDMPICPQYRFNSELIWRGNEDCLYMNVYTPCMELRNKTKVDKKYPVIVFIHGGGFITGVADQSHVGPDYLIRHDVVFVSFNFRLGPFGFLNLYTKNALGNNGLKDQVVALQWVKENIADYCGDSDSVTILGLGAGAKMVQYHAFSPMSKGLFHRSIQESPYGTHRAVVLKPKEPAFALGREFGIHTEDPDELLNRLKKIPTKAIITAGAVVSLRRTELNDNHNAWTPSVEAEIKGAESERFLVDFPDTSSKTGPINEMPYLMGANLDEGAIFVEPSVKITPEWVKNNMENFIPMSFNITDPRKRSEAAEKIGRFYFYKNGSFEGSRQRLIELYSDAYYHITFQIDSTTRAARAKSNVYRYSFEYRSTDSLFRKQYPSGKAAAHFDESEYVVYWNPYADVPKPNTHQMALVRTFSKLWTNFAKYGNPVQQKEIGIPVDKWNPLKQDDYLEINYKDRVTLTNRRGYLFDRMKFWMTQIYVDAFGKSKQYYSHYFNDKSA